MPIGIAAPKPGFTRSPASVRLVGTDPVSKAGISSVSHRTGNKTPVAMSTVAVLHGRNEENDDRQQVGQILALGLGRPVRCLLRVDRRIGQTGDASRDNEQ